MQAAFATFDGIMGIYHCVGFDFEGQLLPKAQRWANKSYRQNVMGALLPLTAFVEPQAAAVENIPFLRLGYFTIPWVN